VIRGFASSIMKRRIDAPNERMAWLLVLGTIPVGLVGLVFEHQLRTLFAKPTESEPRRNAPWSAAAYERHRRAARRASDRRTCATRCSAEPFEPVGGR
jgi:hypothetical protein